MSSHFKTRFFAVGWTLDDDPEQLLRVGPPMFLRKISKETGELILTPRSRDYMEHFVERWNKFAERGEHQVVEIPELTFEIVRQIKKVYGSKFKLERR